MELYRNYDIYKHNTMRLHCTVNIVYVPENVEELIELVTALNNERKSFRLLSAGSNVILPARLNVPVILLTAFNNELVFKDGLIECGASVRIQHLIREAQKQGLGGVEYLFSVPCCVGGAIYMNAGRGNKKDSISNYVVSVVALNLKTGKIETLSNEECSFSFRSSVFFNREWVILNAVFKFLKMDSLEIENRIKQRMVFSKEKLDAGLPSAGSVFCVFNGRIINLLRGLKFGGARYSKKTSNWISNYNNATNYQIRSLIRLAVLLHRMTFSPFRLEVELW